MIRIIANIDQEIPVERFGRIVEAYSLLIFQYNSYLSHALSADNFFKKLFPRFKVR